jgi:Bardet-Biedl syndrome 1 protein
MDHNSPTWKDEPKRRLWLDALYDPLTSIRTNTGLMAYIDLNDDGETSLAACDLRKKLKIYKGMQLIHEFAMIDEPTAMCVCYTDDFPKRVPNLAVAAGSYIFIYRDMKPYRKWKCPSVDVDPEELDVWRCLGEKSMEVDTAYATLGALRSQGTSLTSRSVELLGMKKFSQQENFVASVVHTELQQQSLITCMDRIKVEKEEHNSMSLLVVGTEDKYLYILPPDVGSNAGDYVTRQQLPDVPVLLNASGLFHAEWRVAVLCRNGTLYSVKNGDVKGKSVVSGVSIQIGAQAIAVAQQDTLLWIGTTENKVCSYSTRGQKQREILLDGPLTDVCIMNIDNGAHSVDENGALLAVALQSGEVRLYKSAKCVDRFHVEGPIRGMLFGRYVLRSITFYCLPFFCCL